MTDLDLEAIRGRADAATPGPWWAWDRGVGWHIAVGPGVDDRGRPDRLLPEGERTDIDRREDAEFIAAARQDVPALVAELERLQRLLVADPVPSESAYDRMAQALADERAAVVEHCDRIELLEADRDYLLELLGEVLATFRQVGGEHMAFAAVPIETLARWTVARGAL